MEGGTSYEEAVARMPQIRQNGDLRKIHKEHLFVAQKPLA